MNSTRNKTGFEGIRARKNKFQARVMIQGKRISSRGFATKEQAAVWYKQRKRAAITA